MSFFPSDCLIRPMCLVNCTSSVCRFLMVHFCGSLFRLLLTKTTSPFEALIVTLSFCVSSSTIYRVPVVGLEVHLSSSTIYRVPVVGLEGHLI